MDQPSFEGWEDFYPARDLLASPHDQEQVRSLVHEIIWARRDELSHRSSPEIAEAVLDVIAGPIPLGSSELYNFFSATAYAIRDAIRKTAQQELTIASDADTAILSTPEVETEQTPSKRKEYPKKEERASDQEPSTGTQHKDTPNLEQRLSLAAARSTPKLTLILLENLESQLLKYSDNRYELLLIHVLCGSSYHEIVSYLELLGDDAHRTTSRLDSALNCIKPHTSDSISNQ